MELLSAKSSSKSMLSRLLLLCIATWCFHLILVIAEDGDVGNSTMKALILTDFGDPNVLQIQTVERPTLIENQVLVKVKAAGICPLDAYIRAGTYARKPILPCILGREVSGIVEDVHPTVKAFKKKGERIFCGAEYGGYAEYVAVSEFDCYPLSEQLTFEQGAAIYTTYFTIFRGLVHRGHVKRGDTILIHDATGILGRAAIEVGKYIGAVVVACVTGEGYENELMKIGADHVIYKSEKNYLRWILTKLNRRGFNMIFELLPNFDLEYDKLNIVKFGRIVEEQNDAAGCILGGIENGFIKPVVSKTFKLEEGPHAHHHLRRSSKEKIVFVL